MPITDVIKIDRTNTPEKFRTAEETILSPLIALLRELGDLEDQYFVQSKRLQQKGRVITFENGTKEEITQHADLKAKFKNLYHQLLDGHCTPELLAQRKDCAHGTHYPSDFNCLRTGCTIIFTMKSAAKATVELLPDDGDIPYDMTDADVRYMAEDFTNAPPHFYFYLTKYRFTMRLTDDGWKIDTVHSSGNYDSRWRRDLYF